MVKTSVVNLNNPNILTVNNDTTIGEDSTDLMVVNSQTRFNDGMYIGGPIIAANNGDIIFGKENDGTFTEHMRISQSNGNVSTTTGYLGININVPEEMLHIYKNTSAQGPNILLHHNRNIDRRNWTQINGFGNNPGHNSGYHTLSGWPDNYFPRQFINVKRDKDTRLTGDGPIIAYRCQIEFGYSNYWKEYNNAPEDPTFWPEGSAIRFHTGKHNQSSSDNTKYKEQMCIEWDGRVGIGTANPQSKLHISSGTSGDCELILEADTDDNNENDLPRILFRQDGGNDWSMIGSDNNYLVLANSVESTGGILFKTGTTNSYTNATERMRINSSGNVGIGTTDPHPVNLDESANIQLCIANTTTSNSGNSGIAIKAYDEDKDAQLYFWTPDINSNDAPPKAAIIAEGTNSYSRSKLHFCMDDTLSNNPSSIADIGNSRMTILSNGNVGIGTDTPISELSVNGKISITSESSTPSQPADGKGYLYSKAGGLPYWRSYDINETALIDNGRQFSFYATAAPGQTGHFLGGFASEDYYQYTRNQTFTIGLVENSSQFFDLNNVEYTVPMDGNYTFGWVSIKLGHSNGSRLIIRRLRDNTYTNLVDSGHDATSPKHTTYTGNLERNDKITWWVYGTGGTTGGDETGLYISSATSISTSAYTLVYGYKN